MPHNPQDTLDKPGAGLPSYHRFFLQYVGFPLLRNLLSWERAHQLFQSEGRTILKRVEGLNDEQLFTKVLVPKTFGIEDNSRYYSAAMVLWHLHYVGETIQQGIIDLSQGKQIDITIKIETYKPFVDIDTQVLHTYQGFLHDFQSTVDTHVEERYRKNYHAHPWFGPLNPYGWLVMCALHQWVHRRQLENILKGLKT